MRSVLDSEELSQDKERLDRFAREARLVAQLNHPNVATLYGFEDGYLVMELVKGETLAERIARGPIPAEEALSLFLQIAEGLEAAHEKGIVHRDLKPANVKITPEGQIKILDFGLAKAFAPKGDVSAESSQSPTRLRQGFGEASTALGVIMGTPSYMSPEQARGKAVDKRTDVWAFGCCLCEALTANKAFEGETMSDIIGAVLRADPELGGIPTSFRPLVRRCLQKDARQRLRDIGDARLGLRESMESGTTNDEATGETRSGRMGMGLGAMALGALLGAVAVYWFAGSGDDLDLSLRGPATHAVLELPEEAPLALGTRVPLIGFDSSTIAVSPDGTELVYVGDSREGTRLYRRAMDGLEVTEIPGTDGAIHPFFSPDGGWVGFLTVGQVKKVRLDGGAPMTLSDARTPVLATWTRDDRIYFAETHGTTLAYVPAAGGERYKVDSFNLPRARVGQVMPDGKSVLLTDRARGVNLDYGDVLLFSLETLETKVVVEFGYDARYVPTGHLLSARSGNVLAVPFDLERSEVTGDAVTVVSGVATDSGFAVAQFGVSDNGSFVYVPGRDASVGKLAWVDRDGGSEFLPVEERRYSVLDLSPDNERIAVHVGDVNDYIWIYDVVREEGRRLPTSNAGYPRWKPSSDAIVLATQRPGEWKLLEQAIDSAAPPRELTSGLMAHPTSWTADARWVALSVWGSYDIRFVDVEDGTYREWSNSASWGMPTFSPDGRWVAHVSDETGQSEIWVRSFPDAKEVRQISVGGGIEPVWNHETGELYYRTGNQWMVTSVSLDPELSWEPPKLAFQATGFIDTAGLSFDVTSDGERLLALIAKKKRAK